MEGGSEPRTKSCFDRWGCCGRSGRKGSIEVEVVDKGQAGHRHNCVWLSRDGCYWEAELLEGLCGCTTKEVAMQEDLPPESVHVRWI